MAPGFTSSVTSSIIIGCLFPNNDEENNLSIITEAGDTSFSDSFTESKGIASWQSLCVKLFVSLPLQNSKEVLAQIAAFAFCCYSQDALFAQPSKREIT